ncbi:hypothetical protein J5N97_026868 [Dioscorea zingiberensis]|uniref:DNA repair protein RAD23 n=1 Tax=Dioscorea zingiberensis TaxID=325984 RepID=A0A9D5H758_9LILI|nr:hypothetical protein J5N97_026868 [Dioscorea zingiberensis]
MRREIWENDLPHNIVTAVEFNHQVRDGLVWFPYAANYEECANYTPLKDISHVTGLARAGLSINTPRCHDRRPFRYSLLFPSSRRVPISRTTPFSSLLFSARVPHPPSSPPNSEFRFDSEMKLTVKTLKGSQFKIEVQPSDTVLAVKKNIEDIQGKDSYPCGLQLLIHSGKVLKDESTLEENNISENGFLVVMLSKLASFIASCDRPSADASGIEGLTSYGNNLEPMVQHLMDIGGGNWDKETVQRALRAAYNNPERAVEYLYSGIPSSAEVTLPAPTNPLNQSGLGGNPTETAIPGASPLSALPNSSPLNMFPQGAPNTGTGAGGGALEFLRNNQQFQALRSMVQGNPQILQPMLQELAKQNPHLLRLIQEHHAEFLQLINEPVEGGEGRLFKGLKIWDLIVLGSLKHSWHVTGMSSWQQTIYWNIWVMRIKDTDAMALGAFVSAGKCKVLLGAGPPNTCLIETHMAERHRELIGGHPLPHYWTSNCYAGREGLDALLKRFDERTNRFSIGESMLAFRPQDIAIIFGLRCHGEAVVFKKQKKQSTFGVKYMGKIYDRHKDAIKKNLLQLVQKKKGDEENFVKLLVVYLLGTMLFPSTSYAVPKLDCRTTHKLDELNRYWRGRSHSHKWLMDGVRRYPAALSPEIR